MDQEENEFCCEFNLRSQTVKDYDGIYHQYWCPVCGKEWVEKEKSYSSED